MTNRVWTAANWLMLAVFVFSAVVQVNDPDPIRWIAIYAIAALACGLEARRSVHWLMPATIAAVALVAAVVIGGHVEGVALGDLFQEWEMRDSGIEQARETGGLLIVAVWMAVVTAVAALRARRSRRTIRGAEPAVR